MRISTGCLPNTAPMIIDLKMMQRALALGTALSLRAIEIGSQHALSRTCRQDVFGMTKDQKWFVCGASKSV